jgi:predicted Zn-dependent protease
MDDTKARAWYQLSDAQFADNQVAWAEGTALEAVRREPANARYTLHYLKVVQASKKPSDFLRELVKAKTRINDSPEITLALARAYSVIGGSNRNAAILYREFLKMAPRHPERTVAEEELAAIPGQFSSAF